MRKLVLAGGIAALGLGLLAIPASASFDPHFMVLSKGVSAHRTSSGAEVFRDKLLEPGNRHNLIGSDHGRCTAKGHVLRCRAVAHLNGEIGGFGDIRVRGHITRHHHRLNVVGGTHDFNGVAGKMKDRGLQQASVEAPFRSRSLRSCRARQETASSGVAARTT